MWRHFPKGGNLSSSEQRQVKILASKAGWVGGRGPRAGPGEGFLRGGRQDWGKGGKLVLENRSEQGPLHAEDTER